MDANERAFTKVIRPGTVEVGREVSMFCKISYRDGKLSITGVEGPRKNGDAWGGCGQIVMHRPTIRTYATGWDADRAAKLYDVWDEWHLNDMRSGGCRTCNAWGNLPKIEVVTYKLTLDAWSERRKATDLAVRAASNAEDANLTETGRALLACELSTNHPPDADSPLSGCYEVGKRETKHRGHVYPSEHPDGVLTKLCDKCGKKYGCGWNTEGVPADVLEWLQALPTTDLSPAWV